MNKLFSRILILSVLFSISFAESGSHHEDTHAVHDKHPAKVDGTVIVHHLTDGETFEIFNPFSPLHPYEIHLTTKWKDLHPSFEKYFNEELFISKQNVMMFLAVLLLILFFTFGFKKDRKVQTGFGNLLEVFIIFIRDEVVYPNMGEKQGKRFLPLILTFFFFIVLMNLLGLIPGSATATGSISVTAGLAIITFMTYVIFGNRDFWRHIFATPGVPLWLLPIMIPVEIIGLFTKPFALAIRLFANMNAGHIIIMAFLGIIINLQNYWVALGSVPMAVAIYMLELFVALLQAYIFSLLSSIFIGAAVLEHEHTNH